MVGKSHDVGTDGTTEQSSYLTIVCVCVLTGEVLVTADFFPSSGHYHCVLHQRVSHHPHQGRVCVCLYVCVCGVWWEGACICVHMVVCEWRCTFSVYIGGRGVGVVFVQVCILEVGVHVYVCTWL